MSCDAKPTSSHSHSSVGIIVCGPCACGKSEVATALARHYQVPFVDADSFHSDKNIQKMSSGVALTDQDRFPWLVTVRQEILRHVQLKKPRADIIQQGQSQFLSEVRVVAACSALSKKYRDILRGNRSPPGHISGLQEEIEPLSVIFVFLKCSREVLQRRLDKRQGHFMKSNMLASQLATLEIPDEEAKQGLAIIVDGDLELSSVLEDATTKLHVLLNLRN